MSAYYLTGIAGAGKTTVRNELARRGYAAFDTDDFGRWKNRDTGKRVVRPDAGHELGWYDDNEWRVRTRKIRQIIADIPPEEPLFLCGLTHRDAKILTMVQGIFCLTLDQETLTHRIHTRSNSDFGKSPAEAALVAGWHLEVQERYRQLGAIMIDASLAVHEVADTILAHVRQLTDCRTAPDAVA